MKNIATPTRKGMKKSTRFLLIMLALLLLCSVVNWGVITNWGYVKVDRLTLMGTDGLSYSALMYVPKDATVDNPAPAFIMLHGASGNARNHESWAVEFARRGVICLAIDNYGAGDGEYSNAVGRWECPHLFANYLTKLDIVDKDRIITGGHSMGGALSAEIAITYNAAVCTISDGAGLGHTGPGGQKQDLFIHDEWYYGRNLLLVNGTADPTNPVDKYRDAAYQNFVADGAVIEDETVIPGKVYGSFEEGNAHLLVEVDEQIHEGAFVYDGHIGALIDFTQKSIELPHPMDATDQVWKYKDICGLISMYVFAFFIMAVALYLIDNVTAFACIKQERPRNIGLRGKELAISIIAAVLFPLIVLYTGAFGLTGILTKNVWPFKMQYTNFSFSVVIMLNIMGGLMFILYHKTWGKKRFNATMADYGLAPTGSTKIDWTIVYKCVVLALVTVAIAWGYLALQAELLGTDFYCLFFGYKPIAMLKVKYYIPYVIIWAICFVISGIGMNVERRLPSTGKEGLDTFVAIVVNAVLAVATITAVIVIHRLIQVGMGGYGRALDNWGVDITRIWGLPAGMTIGVIGNTYMYRKTGNSWCGAILMGFVAALCACLYGQMKL